VATVSEQGPRSRRDPCEPDRAGRYPGERDRRSGAYDRDDRRFGEGRSSREHGRDDRRSDESEYDREDQRSGYDREGRRRPRRCRVILFVAGGLLGPGYWLCGVVGDGRLFGRSPAHARLTEFVLASVVVVVASWGLLLILGEALLFALAVVRADDRERYDIYRNMMILWGYVLTLGIPRHFRRLPAQFGDVRPAPGRDGGRPAHREEGRDQGPRRQPRSGPTPPRPRTDGEANRTPRSSRDRRPARGTGTGATEPPRRTTPGARRGPAPDRQADEDDYRSSRRVGEQPRPPRPRPRELDTGDPEPRPWPNDGTAQNRPRAPRPRRDARHPDAADGRAEAAKRANGQGGPVAPGTDGGEARGLSPAPRDGAGGRPAAPAAERAGGGEGPTVVPRAGGADVAAGRANGKDATVLPGTGRAGVRGLPVAPRVGGGERPAAAGVGDEGAVPGVKRTGKARRVRSAGTSDGGRAMPRGPVFPPRPAGDAEASYGCGPVVRPGEDGQAGLGRWRAPIP
jgi:hypothetical protein